MRLKSLDIKGFKSFADKTQVLLDHPITGIVGPNGCGKSNIVDAIRWVIGEHKIKALRSDNLDDLIFNGSKTRNGSGMAEVSLTFENTRNLLPTEFTTVTITRKFYKSGESEYRLNDVTCRLKDIHNLFLDTGVSNDSYAIIELGMVDDIIKDKDGARRRMLEQAAGISIYKTRRKEATAKLEATESDISRIEDLLFEIAANLRTLESQARKAERYLVIKGEYKEISIELAKASLEHSNEQYKTLHTQNESESDRKAALDAHVATEEAGIEEEKLRLISSEGELSSLQKTFNELLGRIRSLEGDKKLAAQRLEHLKERKTALEQFLAGAGQQLASLEENIAFAEKSIAREIESMEEMRTLLEVLRTTADHKREAFDEKKRELDTMRSALQTVQHRRFDAEKKVAVADTALSNIQRSIQHVQEEQQHRAAQVSSLATERASTEEKLTVSSGQLTVLMTKQEEVKGKILESQEELEGLRATLVEENRKLDARRNEHDLLKSLVDSLEGFPDSIKFLKKNKDWNTAAPLLSDIFTVHPEYRIALESVLDQYLNYFVVEGVEEAARAVRLLEAGKKGKANFFLLDKISEGNGMHESRGLPDFYEQAIHVLDVIEVDAKYRDLARHLLRNVYIFPNLPEETLPEDYVLVDKSGRYKSTGFTVTGGSVGLFEGNKIGRAKNLERLADEIATLTASTTGLRTSIAKTQTALTGYNQALADRQIEGTRQEIARLQNSIISIGHRVENFEGMDAVAGRRLQELQQQLTENNEKISGTRAELESIRRELSEGQSHLAAAEGAFKLVENDFQEATHQYNAQNIAYTRQQSKIDSLKQELKFRTGQLGDTQRQIATSSEQLAVNSGQLEETEKSLHAGDTELYDLLKKKEGDERALNTADRAYYELRNAVSARESALNGKRREREAADAILSGIKDKLNEMKLQLTGMKERLAVEFRVNLDEILDQPRTSETSVEELTAEAERLRKRLENMGEVNPTAIEAYTEIKARHDFIVEQKTDLVNAKESLLATIEEVELTANAKFRETFDAVRTNFVQVFQALFTADDNADLRLTDPDNIAESGIEIYAQPKGKKPSTLTQLSGGEKTLTSTAFLFAIYLIKPAPFCILDEVDAPLDDANVGKFTNMIRQFSDNSQFIIVTHNKQTMAAMDVIYGVTMQEPGVSKLVPVDFRSLN